MAELRGILRGVFLRAGRQDAWIMHTLRSRWPQLVGVEFAEKCFPLRLKRGTLWIGAPNSAWAHELQFQHHALLASLQAFFEDTHTIRTLRFQQAEPPPQSTPARPPPLPQAFPGRPAERPLPSAQPPETSASRAAGSIQDPRLRRAMLRFTQSSAAPAHNAALPPQHIIPQRAALPAHHAATRGPAAAAQAFFPLASRAALC